MKRHILSILTLGIALSGMAQTFIPDSLTYRILADGTAEVSGYRRLPEGMAIIPETVKIDGKQYTVTSVGEKAFAKENYRAYYNVNTFGFAAVYLPETVTRIGDEAFSGCDQTTYVRMPSRVSDIGDMAFYNCQALGHIDLPQTLTGLGNASFYANGLYTIGADQLPNLTSVGSGALENCTQLRNFPLTDKVTSLGASAFSGCSSLQEIYLPKGLKEIPDGLLSGCSSIRDVNLPSGITRIGVSALQGTNISTINVPSGVGGIGRSAFMGSTLTDIDLSKYRGKIGLLAFNYCASLDRLTLPADNPYCYTSADGKVLYEKSGELLSVLPTVEELIISYPATGRYTITTTDTLGYGEDGTPYVQTYENHYYPLAGNFLNLRKLEVPYTWAGEDQEVTRSAYFDPDQLREITVRSQMPFYLSDAWRDDALPNVYVFNYAQDNFKKANQYTYGYNWSRFEYQDIDRPTEQLYVAEVWPMYEGRKSKLGKDAVVWGSDDWSQELEEKLPQYFSSDTYNEEAKAEYRDFQLSRYMTDEKVYTYGGQPYEIVHCIDGNIRLSSAFDVNDYANWYLHNDTVYANDLYNRQYVGTITHVESGTPVDDEGKIISNSEYWMLGATYGSSTFELDYALNMVPGYAYDVDLLVAPYHYGRQSYITATRDTIPLKERVEYRLLYNDQNEDGQMTESAPDILIVEYNGSVQAVRLYEDMEVKGDWGNKLRLNVLNLQGDYSTRYGYDRELNIVGIVAKPKTDIPLLPTGVEKPADSAPVPVAYYDLSGRRLPNPVRGVNIVRMSDGTTRKVMLR